MAMAPGALIAMLAATLTVTPIAHAGDNGRPDPASADAAIFLWQNPLGGSFQDPSNWNFPSVPGLLDEVVFNLNAPLAYTVTFAEPALSRRVDVNADNVTLDLGALTYNTLDGLFVATSGSVTGRLTILDGYVSASDFVSIGNASNSDGRLTLTGANTTLDAGGQIWVGTGGLGDPVTAQLAIFNGATLNANGQFIRLAATAGNQSNLVVSGPGSTLNDSTLEGITVGGFGFGGLGVSDGATVNTTKLVLGQAPGSTGDMTVSGAATTLNVFGPIDIAPLGSANVLVTTGALVEGNDPSPFDVGPGGLVEFSLGGRLITRGVATIGGSGAGVATMNVLGSGSLWSALGEVRIGTGGAALLTIGAGGLVEGRNPNPYIVGPEGLVAGNGTLIGNAISSGIFSPGFSTGELTLIGDYTQLEGGTLRVELLGVGPGMSDNLEVSGAVTLGGTLEILTGFVPGIGDSFDVISYGSVSGGFDAVTGLDLGGVMTFDADFSVSGLTLIVTETTGLSIDPPSPTVGLGGTVKLDALTQLANGGSADASADAVWTSDDPLIATVASDGLVTAVANGVTTIRATFQGFQAAAPLTVGGVRIPTVSQWGLVVMTLLILTAGTMVFRARALPAWERPSP